MHFNWLLFYFRTWTFPALVSDNRNIIRTCFTSWTLTWSITRSKLHPHSVHISVQSNYDNSSSVCEKAEEIQQWKTPTAYKDQFVFRRQPHCSSIFFARPVFPCSQNFNVRLSYACKDTRNPGGAPEDIPTEQNDVKTTRKSKFPTIDYFLSLCLTVDYFTYYWL